jgi:hypothetical protein
MYRGMPVVHFMHDRILSVVLRIQTPFSYLISLILTGRFSRSDLLAAMAMTTGLRLSAADNGVGLSKSRMVCR